MNDYKPTANARIVSYTIFGADGQYASVSQLRRVDDGSFAFDGLYNGSNESSQGVGAFNADGSVRGAVGMRGHGAGV